MPVSRRELLAGLGIGVMGGMFVDRIEQAMDRLDPRIDLLPSFEQKLAGFRSAARSMPPSRLIGSMIGQIALLDNLRRRAPIARYRDYLTTQARYAESLSWLCEEAGDIGGALYWVDRTAQWSQAAQWTAMIGYNVRPPFHADHQLHRKRPARNRFRTACTGDATAVVGAGIGVQGDGHELCSSEAA
ncbi:hypothetical protein [Nocardia terpenica]|uniref:hypothetical protein n=1 Tax=Nocardia terpenica TaxID=455432 RepID=UPI0012FE544D|nr:hypothetical protein [Nocardia terpenica]